MRITYTPGRQINTIHNDEYFHRILPYEEMRAWFPNGGYPSDIDGEYERNRHHLWFEWKVDGVEVKRAQMLCIYSRLGHLGHYGTQMIIYHRPTDSPNGVLSVKLEDVVRIRVLRHGGLDATFVNELEHLIKEWVNLAEGRPSRLLAWVEQFSKS